MLPQIETFVEVAHRQNLSRAAEALFVSQPTLTARLQSLEGALGEQLFVRTRRGMRLTEAGSAFLPYAEHALRALADGREHLDLVRRGAAGRLVLGAPPTVSAYTLPALLARFSSAHPGVRLAVKTGTSEEVLGMVVRDQVQLGIIRTLASQEVESLPLYTDTLVLIAGPDHRLASARTGRQARMADLAGEVLVLFGRSSSYLELTTAAFRQAGVLPDSVLELDNIEAAKKMVERGLGVSLVPASTVAAELAAGTLTRIELVDSAPVRREIVAVRRRDAGPPSGAVALFLDMLAELPMPG
ncbi:MAG TPA: LysR substrate-binding domain-containing protein [Actinomycetota bacterium]|jgi:DNA-binding transcriptional LysR family regulator|nr:LysR substrate-binding domain-containing protein [Actinomycetota bacterium]